jgi:hypothetical protein
MFVSVLLHSLGSLFIMVIGSQLDHLEPTQGQDALLHPFAQA